MMNETGMKLILIRKHIFDKNPETDRFYIVRMLRCLESGVRTIPTSGKARMLAPGAQR